MIRLFGKMVVVAVATCGGSLAHAGGWYHMPTSFCQCMGWGFGPGYHAPLVLGPHHCGPTMPQRVIRLPCAPYGVGVGCEDCDRSGLSQLPACRFPTTVQESPVEYPAPTMAQPPQVVEQPASSVTSIQRPLFGPPTASALGR